MPPFLLFTKQTPSDTYLSTFFFSLELFLCLREVFLQISREGGRVCLICHVLTGWGKHNGLQLNPCSSFPMCTPLHPPACLFFSLAAVILTTAFRSALLLIAVATATERGRHGNTPSRFFLSRTWDGLNAANTKTEWPVDIHTRTQTHNGDPTDPRSFIRLHAPLLSSSPCHQRASDKTDALKGQIHRKSASA